MRTENQKHEQGMLSKVKPVKWRKFQLTSLFAFTAIVAISLVTTLVVNRIASEIAMSNLIMDAEEHATRDAAHLIKAHFSGDGNQLTSEHLMKSEEHFISSEEISNFHASAEALNIVKFNLFDLNRVAVWSTDPASIGKINHSTSLWTKAETGGIGSKLERDKTLVVLSGESRTADIVETYLPLRDVSSGEIIGIVEVYSDVGNQYALGVVAIKGKIRRIVFASLGGLFLVLVGFIVAADITIHRSNQRQTVLAAEAQQMLEDRLQQQITNSERLEAEVADRQRAEEEQRRLGEEKEIVAEIGQIISSTLNIEEVYEKFAREMKKLVDFDRASINLIDQEAGTRTLKYLYGPAREDDPVGSVQSLQDTPSQKVLDTGQTLRRKDAADDVRYPSDLKHAQIGMRAAITVPLNSTGRIIGTMVLRSKQVGAFGPSEQVILERLANQIAPAVANAQLYERTKQIQEEVHRLSLAVATMNDGLLIVDMEGRIFFSNPSAEQMYGFEPGEMKGTEIWSLRSDGNDITGRQLFETVKAGETWTGEIIARRKNGEEFPIRLSSALVVDEGGQPVGAMSLNTDITERKQAEEQLRAFAADLERSNRELQEFAYVASHDLQEPLRKVEAFGDRLKTKYGEILTGQGQDYLERMLHASGRMRSLITDLLSFSRVTTTTQSFVPIDLVGIVGEVVSDLEVTIEQAGGRVEVGDLPTIEGDPAQMRQLLQNLIGNGLKFRRPEEPPVVKIHSQFQNGSTQNGGSYCPDDQSCQIVVEDNGIGFDEKYVDRIFTVFQRLHGRDQYEGTGVGLAVCRKIADRHGGTITAKSVPGQGAKFIVTLPVKQPEGKYVRSTNGAKLNPDAR